MGPLLKGAKAAGKLYKKRKNKKRDKSRERVSDKIHRSQVDDLMKNKKTNVVDARDKIDMKAMRELRYEDIPIDATKKKGYNKGGQVDTYCSNLADKAEMYKGGK
jgi:hypothetical protein